MTIATWLWQHDYSNLTMATWPWQPDHGNRAHLKSASRDEEASIGWMGEKDSSAAGVGTLGVSPDRGGRDNCMFWRRESHDRSVSSRSALGLIGELPRLPWKDMPICNWNKIRCRLWLLWFHACTHAPLHARTSVSLCLSLSLFLVKT